MQKLKIQIQKPGSGKILKNLDIVLNLQKETT